MTNSSLGSTGVVTVMAESSMEQACGCEVAALEIGAKSPGLGVGSLIT